jgi:LCP family protein required for cell wall assembly
VGTASRGARARSFRRRVTLAAVAGTVAVAGLAAGVTVSLRTSGGVILAQAVERVRPPFAGRSFVNVLLIGVDDKIERGRSDTLILARVDTESRQIRALSIPRDTRAAIADDSGYNKINSAYPRGGAALTIATVSRFAGVPVDYYVKTDFSGFKQLVDMVGGIDLDVEREMHYDDNWGNLHIHLAKGAQRLDGEKAMQYIRFRKSNRRTRGEDGSDISRIGRQQKFVRALADRMFAVSNLSRLPRLVREAEECVETDLSHGDMLYLARLSRELGSQQIHLETVPGRHAMRRGVSYWLPDEEEMETVIDRTFRDASAPTESVPPVHDPSEAEARG